MLQIIDINTNAENSNEVELLKNDFKERLEPTVKHGTVIIINNFPAIGNLAGKVDYLIILSINKIKDSNYLSLNENSVNN
jgi:hypothetical protein